ncbi:cyclic nucleotide-gated cation channel alpha-3-like isoform X2 [Paramacrobiotus metropolitanus]|nr:cyclic nucleotide-gated cation channel alpha-3-like isoform X2 [Paramacrobiotus metropolitanus]XP_055347745.1 cyclic nucleotide-gated cation channel alpha-3-like isoform X2 [Paramacrobiotus metropolitanus]
MLDPESILYYRWSFVVFVAIFYNILVIIPRSVFDELDDATYLPYFLTADYLADLIYFVDIFVRMLTSYLKESDGIYIRQPRKLMRHWLKSWLGKFDLISLIPTDIAFIWVGVNVPYTIIRLNRVLKYGRIIEFTRLTESRLNAGSWYRLFILLSNFLVLIHWNACFFYLISARAGLDSDEWVYPGENGKKLDHISMNTGDGHAKDPLLTKYIICFYRSLHTLTMIGIVEQPQYPGELLFMVGSLLVSVMLFSQILGNVSRTIINQDIHGMEFRTNITSVKAYMEMRNIGEALRKRIINHFEHQWVTRETVDERKTLTCLHDKLESELSIQVHLETMKRVRIFQGVEPGLLMDLVMKLKLQVFLPGDYVCRKGDIGRELYIVKRGCLSVVSDDGETVFATIGEGSVFGEISILNIAGIKSGNRRTANVRSIGYSDLFCLSKEDLWESLGDYPEGQKKMVELGKQLLIKDNLLDTEAAEQAERRKNAFLNKLDNVEAKIENIQIRFASLVAERAAAVQKLEKRLARIDKMMRLQGVIPEEAVVC